jgi:hypothetical protein
VAGQPYNTNKAIKGAMNLSYGFDFMAFILLP